MKGAQDRLEPREEKVLQEGTVHIYSWERENEYSGSPVVWSHDQPPDENRSLSLAESLGCLFGTERRGHVCSEHAALGPGTSFLFLRWGPRSFQRPWGALAQSPPQGFAGTCCCQVDASGISIKSRWLPALSSVLRILRSVWCLGLVPTDSDWTLIFGTLQTAFSRESLYFLFLENHQF